MGIQSGNCGGCRFHWGQDKMGGGWEEEEIFAINSNSMKLKIGVAR